MSKRSNKKRHLYDGKYSFPPWATSLKNPDDALSWYFRIGGDLLEHPAFCHLSLKAKHVYFLLNAYCAGNREFSHTYTAADRAWVSESSYSAALKELSQAGFIRYTSGQANMKPNRIVFVDKWKETNPERPTYKPRGNPGKLKNRPPNFDDDTAELADSIPQKLPPASKISGEKGPF